MDYHLRGFQYVKDAIDDQFSDTMVSLETRLDEMIELQKIIDSNIRSLKDDIRTR